MKKLFTIIMAVGFISFFSGISYVIANEDEKFQNPWVSEEDKTLQKLIKSGYRVVGCTATTINGRPTEIIYVQYLDKLYRCITTEDGKFGTHYCQSLKSQKKVVKEREKLPSPVKSDKKANGNKGKPSTPARP